MSTTDVTTRRASLSAAKRALLEKRLTGRDAEKVEQTIPRRKARSYAPLSFAQQRLWFLHQLEPDSIAYNMPTALRLTGRLNTAALEWGINEIIRRHEILRTTFRLVNNQPVQIIAEQLMLKLPIVDVSTSSADEREVMQFATEEAQRPFDLETGPLVRARLLRLNAEEWVLMFTMHHIIADGWSMGVLVNELGQLYEAFAADRPSPLQELPVQYADYAIWQREWLQGEVLQTQVDYWRTQLADAPADLQLPVDRPETPNRRAAGASYDFTIPSDVAARLREICRSEETTLFMVMLTAFSLLLSRYSGQENILVGTMIAGRQRLELERLIGFFVNTLVLRVDLNGAPDFHELLPRVRQTTLAAYAHQDVPFEKLVSELQPERSLSQNPFFKTAVLVQNIRRSDLKLEGLQLERIEPDAMTAKFDLYFVVAELDTGMAGSFVYSTDLFNASTIAAMTESLQKILRQATGTDAAPIETEAKPVKEQLLNAFNAALD